jgi:alkaline phosphatase
MKRLVLVLALLASQVAAPPVTRARNVILLLADAAGIPTINAASRYGYGAPQRLYVQRMPQVALSDTSTASEWVTDSAAGMTAIVSGVKTHNGVIGQGPDAVRGTRDGRPLKTLLDCAEERGLSTGIITNDSIAGATPASLYAHANDRGKYAEIVRQAAGPHSGDGLEVLIGPARAERAAVTAAGGDLDVEIAAAGVTVFRRPADVPASAARAFVLADDNAFDFAAAVDLGVGILAANPKGYFLMIESDAHTDRPEAGLKRLVAFDTVIRNLAARVGPETLLLFTADHSFDLRIHDGHAGDGVLDGMAALAPSATRANPRLELKNVRIDNTHTGEEVLVAAQGPGADRVHGYLANTDIFRIILDAWGW